MAITNAPQTTTIEAVFLKEFVRQLIINSKPKSNVDKELIERVRLKLGMPIPIIERPMVIAPSKETPKSMQKAPLRPILRSGMPLGRQPMGLSMRRSMFTPQNNAKTPIPKPQILTRTTQPSTVPSNKEQVNLGKLRPFFLDNTVTGIECPGPNKNLLVNRGGRMQTGSVTLTAEEMDTILKDFSQKTKVPLISGIFKALYNNLLITAVISETAGNRFIIEKHFGQPSLPKKEDIK